ncbi:hypothetical protein BH23GEM7_BH23GEM7_28460 [soil metagenome]
MLRRRLSSTALLVPVVLLAGCEHLPVSTELLRPQAQNGMVRGMTLRGPEAGPLSTQAPRILGPGSLAPEPLPGAAPAGPPPGGLHSRARAHSQSATPRTLAATASASGTPGILWQHTGSGARVLWQMNGAAWTGEYTSLPTVDPAWDLAASGDFNGDGQTDLLWQHLPTGARAIWFMNGAVWEGGFAYLPLVDPAWRITGVFVMPGGPEPTVTGISAGWDHSCGVTAAGQGYCWGGNAWGQLGEGSTTPRTTPVAVAGGVSFQSISAGSSNLEGAHSCGLAPAGQAYCWGANFYGQLGDGTTAHRSTPVPVVGGIIFASPR